MFLESINGPEDVRRLDSAQRAALAAEVRRAILHKTAAMGGHVGSNLGVVELTIALCCVFEPPRDRIIFDVSHQTYAHKILTGRRSAFLDEPLYDSVSGFTDPAESPYDLFRVGHTSTSISLACGMARARDMRGEKGSVVAIIGDGSLSGGEAMEGLDYAAGELKSNFIVIVNDNAMSIAENHGGIYGSLAELRRTGGRSARNPFTAIGLDYRYVEDGNDTDTLIGVLEEVRDIDHPIVVHIHTRKGMGYAPAEANKEEWHFHAPFDEETGSASAPASRTYLDETGDILLSLMKEDPEVAGIIAGTPTVFGFTPERRAQAGSQLIDVGIAEEHAIAMASGMAKAGGRPVVGMYASFLQRAYDQMMHDVCVNGNPAVFCVCNASIWGMRDVSHLGLFDIAMLGSIPGLLYLAPTNVEELNSMMRWAVGQHERPVAIRVPCGVIRHAVSGQGVRADYTGATSYTVVRRGSGAAIIAAGDFFALGSQAAALLSERGINVTLINPQIISDLDEPLLSHLCTDHSLVVTLEDGILPGGFGQRIAAWYAARPMRVVSLGFPKAFMDRFDPDAVMRANGLEPHSIADMIERFLRGGREERGRA